MLKSFLTLLIVVLLPVLAQPQIALSPPSGPKAKVAAHLAEGIGSRIKESSTPTLEEARGAATAFNAYLLERTGYSLGADMVRRLGEVEWGARQKGQGTIPVGPMSDLATRYFLDTLDGPGAEPPASPIGTPYFVITPEKFNATRLIYRRYAPSVTASALGLESRNLGLASNDPAAQNAFPLEAVIALYTCISEDVGMGQTGLREHWLARQTNPASAMTPSGEPFGDHGWMFLRPVSKLLTDDLVNKIIDLAL